MSVRPVEPRRGPCPIWPDFPAIADLGEDGWLYVQSARAGGNYLVAPEAAEMLKETIRFPTLDGGERSTSLPSISKDARVRLTSWLVDQMLRGEWEPTITTDVITSVQRSRRSFLPHQRADRLLRLVGNETQMGTTMQFAQLEMQRNHEPNNLLAYAWASSTDWVEIEYLLRYLEQRGWLECFGIWEQTTLMHCRVTVDGHTEIGRQLAATDSSQVFVAMWFDDSMSDAYREGIQPAIKAAGYRPVIISGVDHSGLVDDAIVAEIRKSRFLVADFTQGDDGARGGVYYEAGFARGLGLEVIFTCHDDKFSKVHFDTNHFPYIRWTSYEDLRERLEKRIEAVVGRGPLEFSNERSVSGGC